MPHCFPPSPRFKIVSPLPRVRDCHSRPEVDRLFEWWREGEAPVCALFGPDGTGKTAIMDRFLRILNDKMAAAEHNDGPRDTQRTDEALPLPEAVFVFPLHAVPNADGFFARLVPWLTGEAFVDSDPRPSALEALERLRDIPPPAIPEAHPFATRPRILLVLDGLEKYQSASVGDIDPAKKIHIPPPPAIWSDGLALLIRRVAAGRVPGVRLLLTARHHIPEVEYANTGNSGIVEIAAGAMSRHDSIALLRKRGLKGFDDDLDAVAERCGRHALSLHLAACTLRAFHEGDACALEKDDLPASAPGESRADPPTGAIADLLRQMVARLDSIDPALRPLLERAALFRLGFTAEMLATLFVGSTKTESSGDALAALHNLDVPARLARLGDLGLLESYPGGRYAVHPALRDAILASMDGEALLACHDRIRRALETVPGGRPALGEATGNPVALDLLEEIIHHSLASLHIRESFNIYWYRMGGVQNLGMALGDFERGERICRAILGALPTANDGEESVYLQAVRPALRNDLALYLDGLGRTGDAAALHEGCIDDALRNGERANAAASLLNLADIRIQQGRLAEALDCVERATALAVEMGDADLRQTACAARGYARFLLGDVDTAQADFDQARHFQAAVDEEDDSLYSGRGVWYARYLLETGRAEEACALTERNKAICQQHFGEDEPTTPRCNAILAEIAIAHGDLDVARALIEQAGRWALAHSAKGLLTELADVEMRIALAAAKVNRATRGETAQSKEDNVPLSTGANLTAALDRLDDALILARECGYGLVEAQLARRRAEAVELQAKFSVAPPGDEERNAG